MAIAVQLLPVIEQFCLVILLNTAQTCMSRFLSGFIRLTGPLGNLGGFHPMSGGSGQCSLFSYGDDKSVLLNPFFCERILENSIVCVSWQCCFRFCSFLLASISPSTGICLLQESHSS